MKLRNFIKNLRDVCMITEKQSMFVHLCFCFSVSNFLFKIVLVICTETKHKHYRCYLK
jgi:hypothetical protein